VLHVADGNMSYLQHTQQLAVTAHWVALFRQQCSILAIHTFNLALT
jgi:hypothetical protein